MTQFAVARYGWMIAAWPLMMRISFEQVGDRILSALVIFITILETWRAAVTPNAPARQNDVLRVMILCLTAIDIAMLVIASARTGFPGLNWGHAWELFALTAEYAKTIRTIPPRKARECPAARASRAPV